MTAPMLRQLRHDVWASEQLLARCRQLAPEQLEITVPGSYGGVRATLGHVVAADENYIVRLLGTLLHEPAFRDPDVGRASLDVIAEHLAHVKDGVERIFSRGEFDPDAFLRDTPMRRSGQPRFEMYAWVPLTQFVHHGNHHRSEVCTTLSQHGIEAPDLQVWPYAIDLGASRQAE